MSWADQLDNKWENKSSDENLVKLVHGARAFHLEHDDRKKNLHKRSVYSPRETFFRSAGNSQSWKTSKTMVKPCRDATIMKNLVQRGVRSIKPSRLLPLVTFHHDLIWSTCTLSVRARSACTHILSVQGCEDTSEDMTPIPSPRSPASAARRPETCAAIISC